MQSPQNHKRSKIGEGGGKTKMLDIQMKVLEPKYFMERGTKKILAKHSEQVH